MRKLSEWFDRALDIGVRPGQSFGLRKRIRILNLGSYSLALFGLIFAVINGIESQWILSAGNLVVAITGLLTLVLNRAGVHTASAAILFIVSGIVFTAGAWVARNGLEHYLITIIVCIFAVIERPVLRWVLIALNAAAFLAVKGMQFAYPQPAWISLDRFLFVLALFLIGLCIILWLFTQEHQQYRLEIEAKNRLLESQKLELQEADRAKAKLFSVLAHDMRGPIGNVKLLFDAMEGMDLTTEEFQEMRPRIQQGVDALYTNLENLLNWAAGQLQSIRPNPEQVPLRSTADSVLELLADDIRRKNLKVSVRIPAEASAFADQNQVHIVFRNLLANAVKFTPHQGSITVSAEAANGDWQSTVADSGIGMPATVSASILESKNYQSARGTENEKGFGLGLKICTEFVRANGGRIWVESAPEQGSRFHFTLPQWKEEERPV